LAAAIDILSPIARVIEEQTRAPGLLATDPTGIPVLDRDAPDGIRQGTIWCWTNARWVSAIDRDNAAQRLARRTEQSAPVVERLRVWLEEQRATVPPRTPLGAALGYLHRRWKRLLLFLRDGNVELTNNRVERELRKLVLGRRARLPT
jgi:transposase